MSNAYDPRALETKWQARWEAEQTFHTPNPGEAGFDAEASAVREDLPTFELPRRRAEPEMLDIPPEDVPF